MQRPARVSIDSDALRHNIGIVKKNAPHSNVMVAVKAQAYGHGMLLTANACKAVCDGFMVASLEEAIVLRQQITDKPILAIQGFSSKADMNAALKHDIRCVIHDHSQLALLNTEPQGVCHLKIALKIDTGMHRLGIFPKEAVSSYQQIRQQVSNTESVWLMSHLACADELENNLTVQQQQCFEVVTKFIDEPRSLANSAGILAWKQTHYDWVRPGIMIYGSSPFKAKTAKSLGLKSTMTFEAPLIAVHQLQKGDGIGYGQIWRCPEDMLVGVVACGYGDGYPRHASTGTPVSVNQQRTQLLGRVSMDVIVIDLRNISAAVGDWVECWGANIAVDEVAERAGTISYELLCSVGARFVNS